MNDVWVVEHSGKECNEWHVWDSKPYISKIEAFTISQELEKTHSSILKFRVTRYIPEPTVTVAPEPSAAEERIQAAHDECDKIIRAAKAEERNEEILADVADEIERLRLKVQSEGAVLAMTVARLGGTVEGHPTARLNFLQRVDELRSIEQKRFTLREEVEWILREGERDEEIERLRKSAGVLSEQVTEDQMQIHCEGGYIEQIERLREALEKIASCNSVIEGDVVSIAARAIHTDDSSAHARLPQREGEKE